MRLQDHGSQSPLQSPTDIVPDKDMRGVSERVVASTNGLETELEETMNSEEHEQLPDGVQFSPRNGARGWYSTKI